jgi:8-oxo-dGTP diphosphatase
MVPDKNSPTGELILPGWLVMKWYSLSDNIDDIVFRKVWLKYIYKEQLYTFWNPDRSKPESHFITTTYFSLVNKYKLQNYVDLTKVNVVEFQNIDNVKIWLNHRKIIKFAKNKLNFRIEYTTIWKYVLPPKFTIPNTQKKYEIIIWEAFDKRNFRKKVEQLDIVKFTWEYDKNNSYRPAKLYEFLDKEIKYLDDDRINLEFHWNAEVDK